MEKQHVYIIGCKGIPARYGGFETFVDQLTGHQKDERIQYHIACAEEPEQYVREKARFRCHHAECIVFPWRKLGPARAITYDIDALRYFLHDVKRRQIVHPIFYILACRIGPVIGFYKRKIEALGGKLYVNPDGHEFLRAKWSLPVRKYWKYSEKLMVKHAHLLVCDSQNIETYIKEEYKKYQPDTTFIAYGADTKPSTLTDEDAALQEWYHKNQLQKGEYYLVVGRFVPENNYETMLREFLNSKTKKRFVLITQVSEKFLQQLQERTGYASDSRICFPGTVYDEQLLKKIRENAYGYLHGHEVGGTNPSLLEALGSTRLNLLLDVGFNREVALDSALYWKKDPGDLCKLLDQADAMRKEQLEELGEKAKHRIETAYSWEKITSKYEKLFLESYDA